MSSIKFHLFVALVYRRGGKKPQNFSIVVEFGVNHQSKSTIFTCFGVKDCNQNIYERRLLIECLFCEVVVKCCEFFERWRGDMEGNLILMDGFALLLVEFEFLDTKMIQKLTKLFLKN